MPDGRFCQVAFSALDARALRRWYVESFCLIPSGGTLFGGPPTSRVQGIPRTAELCIWALDTKSLFQLEFFQFWSPKPKPRHSNWRPSDLGYALVGFHTTELDAVHARMCAAGSTPMEPEGAPGARSFAVRDPEGNWVLVFERDPLAGIAPPSRHAEARSTLRMVRLSVPDLHAARKAWTESFGLEVLEGHTLASETEAWWGLDGSKRDVCALHGGGMILELAQYTSPQPAARPVGRRICDQGIMNVAIGFHSTRAFDRGLARAREHGCRPNGRPLDAGVFKVMYVREPVNGESVELLHPRPWAHALTGFTSSNGGHAMDFGRAFVSGGGSGIGREFCRQLVASGAELAVFDLRFTPEGKQAILDARKHTSQRVRFFECDVTDSAGFRSAFDAAVDDLGAPDLALGVAGVQLAKSFEDFTDEEYDRVIRVNLLGARSFARAALPHLQRGATLGLVASLAGITPVYNYSAYSASKAGVVGLAGALRLEYAPKGIAVCAICPPEVPTPMVDDEKLTMHPATREMKKFAGSLPTEETCRAALRELAKGVAIIVPGARAKAVYALTKLVPAPVLNWVTDRVVKRALREGNAS